MDDQKRLRIQVTLFVVTILTTTASGAEWMYMYPPTSGMLSWAQILDGFQYSIPFLLILTCHEFGHYFTARYHNIKVTLPYYIPFWFFGIFISFGTMGAFISIREKIESRTKYFDVGVAGPIAGFVVALVVIWYGFTHLPDREFIYEIHPEYEIMGDNYQAFYELDTVFLKSDLPNPNRANYQHLPDTIVQKSAESISIRPGSNLLYFLMQEYVVEDASLMPHPNEIIHYPILLVGYLALFFTALNLLPIGQLDGGHVIFSVFGERISRKISAVMFTLFVFYAGLGVITPDLMKGGTPADTFWFAIQVLAYLYFLYICFTSMIESKRDRMMLAAIILAVQFVLASLFQVEGYYGWLLFSLLLGRFFGVYHPPVADNRPLSTGRIIVAVLTLIIFILSFSPQPLIFEIRGV